MHATKSIEEDHIMVLVFMFQVCNELDDEKHKHAQDTAQGDDVTYMLEKERERLKQEVSSILIIFRTELN